MCNALCCCFLVVQKAAILIFICYYLKKAMDDIAWHLHMNSVPLTLHYNYMLQFLIILLFASCIVCCSCCVYVCMRSLWMACECRIVVSVALNKKFICFFWHGRFCFYNASVYVCEIQMHLKPVVGFNCVCSVL